ncbi:MAG TPA: hypothetical protein VMW24_24690 [Sedimentisphaerales bacterium]|nr:hypothetical protein [Sedimentisphaerales bacterium]
MPIIRLTETAWQNRELNRVRAVLTQNLKRTGMEQSGLIRFLKRYLGTVYTPEELLWFRDQLINEGSIEIEG